MHTAQFSLRSLFLWLAIAALWLGALQSARSANVPLEFAATLLAALATCYWFHKSIPTILWYTLAVIIASCITAAIFMPSPY